MTYTTRIAEAKSEAREEGIKYGISIGEKLGEECGISLDEHKKAIETAKSMKSENMSASLIARFTGLSSEEIEKL